MLCNCKTLNGVLGRKPLYLVLYIWFKSHLFMSYLEMAGFFEADYALFTKEFESKPYYEMYIYFIRLKNVPKFPRNVKTVFSTHCHNFLILFFLL